MTDCTLDAKETEVNAPKSPSPCPLPLSLVAPSLLQNTSALTSARSTDSVSLTSSMLQNLDWPVYSPLTAWVVANTGSSIAVAKGIAKNPATDSNPPAASVSVPCLPLSAAARSHLQIFLLVVLTLKRLSSELILLRRFRFLHRALGIFRRPAQLFLLPEDLFQLIHSLFPLVLQSHPPAAASQLFLPLFLPLHRIQQPLLRRLSFALVSIHLHYMFIQ
jgi:hypothetical protein